MIETGDRVPDAEVRLVTADGVSQTTTGAIFGEGLTVLFTVPGAFTPTCHVNHLPGFLANAAKLRAAGVTRIVCAAGNDHHVLKAWGEATGALGTVDFIADPRLGLAEALGLDKSFEDLGQRYRRSAMIFRDGRARGVYVEDQPGVAATGAQAILVALAGGEI